MIFSFEVFKKNVYNFRNWCVSRQLWWGHQIPAYFCIVDNKKNWVIARSKKEALQMFNEKYGNDVEVFQDSDVLDTWFSSAILPFSCFGWPDKVIKKKKS